MGKDVSEKKEKNTKKNDDCLPFIVRLFSVMAGFCSFLMGFVLYWVLCDSKSEKNREIAKCVLIGSKVFLVYLAMIIILLAIWGFVPGILLFWK